MEFLGKVYWYGLVWAVYPRAGKHTIWELLGNVPIIRLNDFDAQLRAATFNGEVNILFDLCCDVLELPRHHFLGAISTNAANTN